VARTRSGRLFRQPTIEQESLWLHLIAPFTQVLRSIDRLCITMYTEVYRHMYPDLALSEAAGNGGS
jgi:hypothetical protein